MAIYYKACRRQTEGSLKMESWAAHGTAKVDYAVGEISIAPARLLKQGYGLLVFKDIEDARFFIHLNGDSYGLDSSYPLLRVESDSPIDLKEMCYIDENYRLIPSSQEWPVGTATVKALTVLSIEEWIMANFYVARRNPRFEKRLRVKYGQ